MGIGDDVIWLGEAAHRYRTTGQKSRPTRDGLPHKPKLAWANCEYVDMITGEPLEERTNGVRPYAQSTDYVCRPAEFRLTAEEYMQGEDLRRQLGSYWIINPDTKVKQHYANKAYPYWSELIEQLKNLYPQQRLVRLQPPWHVIPIEHLHNITTENERDIISLVRTADLVITTEGLLHHVAAGWHRPTIVLYGSNTSPYPSKKHNHSGTGYPGQCNIISQDEHAPCYSRDVCDMCSTLWQQLTPDKIMTEIQDYIKAQAL